MMESGSEVYQHHDGRRRPKKDVWSEELTCQPLDTYTEILNFLQDPPPWRTLCQELTPHSKFKLRNMDLNIHHSEVTLETPDSFCHFYPDAEDVERHDENTLPKTLICHDMANGYHDDSFIDGTGEYDAYTFYNWAGIDIFCYFSHHLITIPPLGWINVGHAHGVKVIGTVITEWAEGIVFWDKILDSEIEYQNFASALVAIAKTLKFDGWLLNVENKISKPEVLLDFVKHLHYILHQEIPHAELIWYDSVTVQGTLNWQNGLNEKNKAFFDACDGLFTNYSWFDYDVRESAIAAGDRVRDLYIGIDVWGRNFYGGGLFNTQEALKVPYAYGCSMAIFAPAWTHEAIATDDSDTNAIIVTEELDKLQQFVLRDRAFWGSLWPFLNTRLPCRLPFSTSFCRGQGRRRRHLGEVTSPQPWYNLRHQQYQPSAAHGPHGYLLSTAENVVNMERQGVLKETGGILKYRQSFLEARHELLASRSRLTVPSQQGVSASSAQALSAQALAAARGRALTLAALNEESAPAPPTTADTDANVDDEPRSVKRKVKNAFRQMFQIKSPRTSETHIARASDGGPGPSRSSDVVRGAAGGKSMLQMQMSVMVDLGHGTEPRTRFALAAVPEERECLEMFPEDSFGGGSCLRVNPSDGVCDEHRTIRLFHGDWPVRGAVVACVVTKLPPGFSQQALHVRLSMVRGDGTTLAVQLVGRTTASGETAPGGTAPVSAYYPLEPGTAQFRALQRHLLLNEPAFYVPVENSFGWTVRYYEVSAPDAGTRITSVNLRTEFAQGPVLLGHFGLCSRETDEATEEIKIIEAENKEGVTSARSTSKGCCGK